MAWIDRTKLDQVRAPDGETLNTADRKIHRKKESPQRFLVAGQSVAQWNASCRGGIPRLHSPQMQYPLIVDSSQ
jgi:hypothetical protein